MKCFSLEDIDWSGDNIKVMGHVTVTPPYKPENVRGVSDSKAVMHVRKIVSMFVQFASHPNSVSDYLITVIQCASSRLGPWLG